MLFGLQHRTFFDRAPAWAALQPLPLDQRLAALADGGRRAELLADAEANTPPLDWSGVFVLTADSVDYAADPTTSLAHLAEKAGETIPEAFVRISL